MKPKSPCYKCEKRTSSCHSNCEDYISYTEENKKFSDKVKGAKMADHLWNDNILKRVRERDYRRKTRKSR